MSTTTIVQDIVVQERAFRTRSQTRFTQKLIIMASVSPQAISMKRITIPINTFIQNINGVPNDPASLYLSTDSPNLILYITPMCTVNVISLSHLAWALYQGEGGASV
jgi:hypothetical protein